MDWLLAINRFSRALGDLMLPRACVVCGRPLRLHEECMCVRCALDLPLTWNWDTPHHLMADQLNALIQECLTAEISEENAVHEPYAYAAALFFYQPGSGYSQLTRRLKYRGDFPTGRFVARLLGERLAASPLYADVDAVVPVPLHWLRRASRGYNQAAIIGKEVADCLGVPMMDLLARQRRTSTQTHLDASHRLANVLGAFSPRPALRSGAGRNGAGRLAVERDGVGWGRVDWDGVRRDATGLGGAMRLAVGRNGVSQSATGWDGAGLGDAGREGGGRSAERLSVTGRSATGWDGAGLEGAERDGANRGSAFLSDASRGDAGRQIGAEGPRHLLLIDDVFTTGSTLAACHAALREVFPPGVRISAATLGCVQ